jgi:hypothetical protein
LAAGLLVASLPALLLLPFLRRSLTQGLSPAVARAER